MARLARILFALGLGLFFVGLVFGPFWLVAGSVLVAIGIIRA